MSEIRRQDIKDVFEKCDKAFEVCWNTLVKLKNINDKDPGLAAELISFQVTLAEPLFELGQLRNKISAHERQLISAKKKYKQSWFKKRMSCLADYKRGITHVINIGKGLGDAFAYFFYRSNLDLIEKHYFHERIDSVLPETGARGELHYLKNIKHLDGKLCIYHGITNILRYGDFSFYDLRQHYIAEIAELKTKRITDNQYQLTLTAISTRTTSEPITGSSGEIPKLDQATQNRLDRQVNSILKILKPQKEELNLNSVVLGDTYVPNLEELYAASRTGKTTVLQAGPGLLFAGVLLRKATLFTRIFNRKIEEIAKNLPGSLIEKVTKLIKNDTPNNSIILGQLLYHDDYIDKNLAGTAPLFWYPIQSELLKNLYFNNLIVMTVFNPAHLIDELWELGFHVKSKYNLRSLDESHFSIDNFDKFLSFVTDHLQTEQTLIKSIEQIIQLKSENPSLGKIAFRPHVKISSLFGMPSPDN